MLRPPGVAAARTAHPSIAAMETLGCAWRARTGSARILPTRSASGTHSREREISWWPAMLRAAPAVQAAGIQALAVGATGFATASVASSDRTLSASEHSKAAAGGCDARAGSPVGLMSRVTSLSVGAPMPGAAEWAASESRSVIGSPISRIECPRLQRARRASRPCWIYS